MRVTLPDLRALRGLRPARPEDQHYHVWVTLPGGVRGTVSGPMMRAIARLRAPVYLTRPERPETVPWVDYWLYLPALSCSWGPRGFRAVVDPEARHARLPFGRSAFPDLGEVLPAPPILAQPGGGRF